MNALKHFRTEAGFTQKELAEKTGISKRVIQNYEQGVLSLERASASNIFKFACALNVTMEDFILWGEI